jgi:hypothetical protein
MNAPRSRLSGYLRFLVCAVTVAALLAALGYVPTRRLGGAEAVPAMLAGCLIGVLAALAGALPVVFGRGANTPAARLQAILLAMAVRFGAILVLGLAAALSGWFERRPLLIWIAISYLGLLVLDTRFLLKSFSPGNLENDVETQ